MSFNKTKVGSRLKCIFKKNFFFFTFLCFFKNSTAQNFEWIQTYGTKAIEYSMGVVAEANGSSVFLYNYQGIGGDTVNLGSFVFKDSHKVQNYLVKLDSTGKVLNSIPVGYDVQMMLKGDGMGNYYVAGFSSGNDSVLKFDKNFKRVWSFKLLKTGLVSGSLHFTEGHLYLCGMTNDSNKIVEVNTSNGNVVWTKNLCKNKYKSAIEITAVVFLKGQLFMSGRVNGSEGFQVGSDTLHPYASFVMQTDTIGNYEKRFLLEQTPDLFTTGIKKMTTDGNFLYICGNYKDTIYWGNKKIIPEYPQSADHTELFAASLTSSLRPRWFFRPKVLDKTDPLKTHNYLTSAFCSKGLLYFSGQYVSKILIDSNILVSPKSKFSILILKSDSLGNILWATNGGFGRTDYLDAVAGQSVYATGIYRDSIKLGNHSKYSNSNSVDVFVTKITDYSITRGRVSSGPYCAGDTIKIPYTKFGLFDTTNRFIAQLSDEYGNFETPYELGRLKSNKDGTIMGKLPLFKVVSSGKYRIRIISTNPSIQSYYRTDTLRLLIYSKDKADPGQPETICKGDTLKLNTYGGTKWTWAPKYNINNISLRQPLVWPLKDTLYSIVIADSSGCGKPDTAFKKVFVKPYPKSILQYTDTAICENIPLKIPARFSGGDSTYQWEWFFVNPDKSFFSMKKGNSKLTDTLIYTPSVNPVTSEKLAIVLKDGCTSKADTAFINITQRKPALINNKYKDTMLCSGQSLKYKVGVSGGIPNYYQYQWKYLISNVVLSVSDSLNIISPKSEKIELIVNDGCEALGDTAMFTIKVKPPTRVSSNLRDTTICFGRHVSFIAKATGGDSTAYNFSWLLGDTLFSTDTAFLLKTEDLILAKGEIKTLSLILKDKCTVPNDTIKSKLTVLPAPIATFSYDLACSRTATRFQFTGTKPQTPVTTVFNWNFNNESISSIENPSKLFNNSGTKEILLTVTSSNGCSDTLKNNLFIKPQSIAEFEVNDVCESDSATFINKSQDATGYNWKFGDGNTSKKESPRHLYKISNQSITYNVTLVAIVTNGCSDSATKAVTINANPISDFTYIKTGTKLQLKATQSNNSKYQWKFGSSDSISTTLNNYTHTITKPEQSKVCLKVINIAGCVSQSCKDITLGILNINRQSGFNLYPNPNTGNFTLDIPKNKGAVYLEIINQIGQIVYNSHFDSSTPTLDLNLDNGVYLIKVNIGKNTLVRRMIVNK